MTHTGEPGFMLYIPIEVRSREDGVLAVLHLLSTSDWALVIEYVAVKRF